MWEIFPAASKQLKKYSFFDVLIFINTWSYKENELTLIVVFNDMPGSMMMKFLPIALARRS